MSGNASLPFLAKFAKAPSKEAAESNSANSASQKRTMVTKVARETTDDC